MKVAVLGMAKTSRNAAPYDDPSWQIWGVNGTHTIAKRLDVILDLHAPWIHEWEPYRRPPGHVAHLTAFRGPVYLIEARPDMPTSRAYPLDDVVRSLGRPYLTGSINMALALAMLQGATEIGLYGVEMATQSEYAEQRPGLEYLIGRAEERGITITLPEGCNILSGPVYGRGDLNAGGERLTPGQFERRLAMLVKRQGELERQAARQDGALLMAQECGASSERLEQLQAEMVETLTTLERFNGMLSEARYWLAQTPEGASQDRWKMPSPVVLPRIPDADRGLSLVRGEAG